MRDTQAVKTIQEIIANEHIALEEMERMSKKNHPAISALRANQKRLEDLYAHLIRSAPKKAERGTTFRGIALKIQEDLHIPFHRARNYADRFAALYDGNKKAISSVKASYTDDGRMKLTYVINDTPNEIILD